MSDVRYQPLETYCGLIGKSRKKVFREDWCERDSSSMKIDKYTIIVLMRGPALLSNLLHDPNSALQAEGIQLDVITALSVETTCIMIF